MRRRPERRPASCALAARFCRWGWPDLRVVNAVAEGMRFGLAAKKFHPSKPSVWQKLDLDFGYAADAEQGIGIEIRIRRLAFDELQTLVQSHSCYGGEGRYGSLRIERPRERTRSSPLLISQDQLRMLLPLKVRSQSRAQDALSAVE